MVVSGVNFTCTAVEIWNAADLTPLTLSVPVTNNWVYKDGVPTFTIKVTNPYSKAVTAKAVVEIATDKMTVVTSASKSQEVAAGGSAEIVVSLDEMPAADKQVIFNPELQHQVKYDGEDNWNATFMAFFKKYYSNTTGISELPAQAGSPSQVCYDLQGRRITTPAKGLYIRNGDKYICR